MAHNQIRFDEKFEARPDAEKIDYLKKLASSSNHALDLMQKERNALAQDNVRLLADLESAQKLSVISSQTLAEHITTSNAQSQEYIAQIQRLQSRIIAQDAVIESHAQGAA